MSRLARLERHATWPPTRCAVLHLLQTAFVLELVDLHCHSLPVNGSLVDVCSETT